MTPDEAQKTFPHAWREIQRQIAEFKRGSGADVIIMSARTHFERGVEKLHVDTSTDLEAGAGDKMGFEAPIVPPAPSRPTLRVV